MTAKVQTRAADAIDVIAGMEDIIGDAEMFARLVDYLAADAFIQHDGTHFSVSRGMADLILFASAKAMDAIKACDERLTELDPRHPKAGGSL